MNKKITIITVCFNSEKTIEKTIESVLNQTYKNIEYIIIDGKSTDNTIKIISKYNSKITKIISEKDKGIYDAMNKGIKHATGEYIYFLNADDVLYDNKTIEEVMTYFNTYTYDLIVGDILCKYPNEKELVRKMGKIGKKYLKNGIMPPHQASFVKTKWLKKYLFDINYKSAADFDFFCKLFQNKITYKKLNKPIAIMNMSGYSVKNIKLSYLETEEIVKKYYGTYYYVIIIIKHFFYYFLIKIRNYFKLNIHKN